MRDETRHSLILTLGVGVTAVLNMVYAIYAGRRLGPAEYAAFSACLSVVALGSVTAAPFNSTLARFAAELASHGKLGRIRWLTGRMTFQVTAYGAAGLILALLCLGPLASVLKLQSPSPLAAAFAIVYLTLPASIARGVLRGVQSFGGYNLNLVSEGTVRLLAGLLLLSTLPRAAPGLMAYVVALAAALILSWFQLRGVWGGQAPEPVHEPILLRFAGPLFLFTLGSAGFQSYDMLFAKVAFPAAAAGHYGAAVALARSLTVLSMPFTTLLLPLLTSIHAARNSFVGPLLRVCGYYLLPASGALLIFGLWPELLMSRLFGTEFLPAAEVLGILAAATLLGNLSTLLGQAFVALGSFRFLSVYLSGLVLEIALLALWHPSLRQVALTVCAIQGLTLVVLAALLSLKLGSLRPPRPAG